MATFGHAALGLLGGRLPAAVARRPRLTQAGFGLLALAPDLDGVIPGLRHDGPTGRTHTPAATLLGTAAVALAAVRLGLPWRRASDGGVRSFVGEAAWALPLVVMAALPIRDRRRSPDAEPGVEES